MVVKVPVSEAWSFWSSTEVLVASVVVLSLWGRRERGVEVVVVSGRGGFETTSCLGSFSSLVVVVVLVDFGASRGRLCCWLGVVVEGRVMAWSLC